MTYEVTIKYAGEDKPRLQVLDEGFFATAGRVVDFLPKVGIEVEEIVIRKAD